MIEEHAQHSWYQDSGGLHPSIGETVPNYTEFDTGNRYSWLKAPRYDGEPMEVGPLARMLVAYGRKMPEAVAAIDGFLKDTDLNDFRFMYSVVGRTAARALETQIIAHAMEGWLDELTIGGSAYQSTATPTNGTGMGLNEAPRGALGHWINIQNGKIGNYQMVVPSTWNFGPRCANEFPGPAEKALEGVPVVDPAKPLEILRTVHSLDPCIACAVHVIDPENDSAYEIKVL
jgi:[NiFe] hydrogenase large subunit